MVVRVDDRLPPLRIVVNACRFSRGNFLVKHARGEAVPRRAAAAAERALLAHDWPGTSANWNVILRALALATAGTSHETLDWR